MLVHAYCNSLLAGVSSDELVNRIQSVLRQPGRLRTRKSDPVSITLASHSSKNPVQVRIIGLQVIAWSSWLNRRLFVRDMLALRGVILTFSWGANFFKFFNATGLLQKWKKQHFICSNLTLFIDPFFPFYLFSLFFIFFLFFFFFFFSFSLGGDGPPAPQMTYLLAL